MHALVATVFEVVGLLLLAGAAGVAAAQVALWAALLAAALVLLAEGVVLGLLEPKPVRGEDA